MIGWGGRDRKMAASSSIVSVTPTASSVPVLPSSCDFSNLREIKKQLLLIAGLTRERGLLHSSKWYDVGVRGDQGWILGLGGLGLIQFVWLFQVCGVGLLPPGIASVWAAAAAAYYRGNDVFTASAPQHQSRYWVPCHQRGAHCLAGMFVEGVQAIHRVGYFKQFYLYVFVKLRKTWCSNLSFWRN